MARRLPFLTLPLRPSFWRYVARRVDHVCIDHLEPWSKLTAPKSAMIHTTASFRSAENIEIGEHTRVNHNCCLWASPNAKIKLGNHSGMGPGVVMFASNHGTSDPDTPYWQQPWVEKDIVIGEDVWLGSGTIITAGVTIGDHTVVAAGSVVTKDIPPYSVVAGIPAKVIRVRKKVEKAA